MRTGTETTPSKGTSVDLNICGPRRRSQCSRGRPPRPLYCLALILILSLTAGTACSAAAEARQPTSDQVSAPSAITISEIMYDPGDAGNLLSADLEFIELHNRSDAPVDLGGAHFSEGLEFAFAEGVVLAAGEYLVLASSASAFETRYGVAPDGAYGGQLDNGGERLTLNNADGSPQISLTYDDDWPWPAAAAGFGFSLVPRDGAMAADRSSDANSWRASASAGGSPGDAEPPASDEVAAILINEVLPHTDPPLSDAIELLNNGDQFVDIGGWYVTDDRRTPRKFRIPDGVTLAPGQFYVLFEDELGFGFSSFGEEVILFEADAEGNLAGHSHGFNFGTSANGVSFGRFLNSEGVELFPPQRDRSLGRANPGPLVGPVVISEIMYHPPAGQDEYIKLTNISGHDVRLYDPNHPDNRWRIDGIGRHEMPAGRILSPGSELLVVPMEPSTFRKKYAIAPEIQISGPYTGTLDNSGERIRLMRPDDQDADGVVPYFEVDAVEYDDTSPWPASADGGGPALRRINPSAYGDDPANWSAGDLHRIYLPQVTTPPQAGR